LQPDRFLGGEFRLHADRARSTVQRWLKRQGTSLSIDRFAAGMIRVVNATMEKAIRVVSVEKGYDPRDFTLVAFGGAGGLHACELAQSLAIPRVIVPAMPGALSAYGILVSDVVKDFSRTLLWRAEGGLPEPELRSAFASLERDAAAGFRREHWGGRPRFQRSLDVRYRGQGFELSVPYGRSALEDFHSLHQQRYGYSHRGREVEIVTLRLRATMPTARAPYRASGPPVRTAPLRVPVMFEGRRIPTQILDRESLAIGRRYPGPAVITEYSATTAVPPGMHFSLDRARNLVIQVR